MSDFLEKNSHVFWKSSDILVNKLGKIFSINGKELLATSKTSLRRHAALLYKNQLTVWKAQ